MTSMRLPVVLAALAGCDDHLFPAVAGGGGECDATWVGVQGFMADNCLTCHGGPDAPAGNGIVPPDHTTLDMHDLSAPLYPEYLGELVVPGERDASVLWQAVAWTGPPEVVGMPIGTVEPLAGHECIGTWIDD